MTKIELSLYARKLKNVAGAFKGISDPFAVVTKVPSHPGDRAEVLDKTEVVKNCLSPEWVKVIVLDYQPGTKVAISIFDEVRKEQNKTMGSAIFDLDELLGARGQTKTKILKGGGTLYAIVRESKGSGILRLRMKGQNLANTEGFLKKSDPFFELFRKVDAAGALTWDNVYQSNTVKNNLSPEWDEMAIECSILCGGDLNKPILVKVFDYESSGRHVLMGQFESSVNGLVTVANEKRLLKLQKEGKDTGVILVTKADLSGAQAPMVAAPAGAVAPVTPTAPIAPPVVIAAEAIPAPATLAGAGSQQPKKYAKVNGVMRLNPEYKRWKEQQGGSAPATTVARPGQALAVVTSMEDHKQLNQAAVAGGGQEVPLAESTSATIEMLQDPEISLEAGMQPDEMVDQLGAILGKYEIPIGLLNKLMMLSELRSLEFVMDDSGSMMCQSDTKNLQTGLLNTRWQEAHERLKEMIEILAYIPFNQIDIEFLNRKDRISLQRNGRDPRTFLADAYRQIDQQFARFPSGTTPYLEKIQETLIRGQGASLGRYFFGDGTPNGGPYAKEEIVKILLHRENPQDNPITFISCTNEDDQVEWMKDAEEAIPYCSESDDFGDECQEVLRDQGAALPYTKGFHLVCQLVAAMNPDDLDAMDESIPFTKQTLDNMLGFMQNEESYRHYFTCYSEAQRNRTIEQPSDHLKKSIRWNYEEFLSAPLAKEIPQVQQFKHQLAGLDS